MCAFLSYFRLTYSVVHLLLCDKINQDKYSHPEQARFTSLKKHLFEGITPILLRHDREQKRYEKSCYPTNKHKKSKEKLSRNWIRSKNYISHR